MAGNGCVPFTAQMDTVEVADAAQDQFDEHLWSARGRVRRPR
jgi:hypothetical protein